MGTNDHLNQPDWEKVLAVLNGQPDTADTDLSRAEQELLGELRQIKAAGMSYQDPGLFDTDARWQQFMQLTAAPKTPVRSIYRRWRYVAAASVLVALAIGSVFYYNSRQVRDQLTPSVAAVTIKPGSNKAVLTLSDGKKIDLNDAASGQIAQQSGSVITKTADGAVTYEAPTGHISGPDGVLAYNTITTPRGGQYRLILPDGTQVWLNADTRLTYPASFAGSKERRVGLSGEAYFEVAHKTTQPFRVVTGSQITEDVGTHFNIEAYNDDADIKTTLTEGAVKIFDNSRAGSSIMLDPGQMATNHEGSLTVKKVNIVSATAWKDGYFIFADEDIRRMMKDLSRWYNVDVVYQGDVSGMRFHGNYLRARSLNKLLKAIEQTNNVTFKIEERRITVIAR